MSPPTVFLLDEHSADGAAHQQGLVRCCWGGVCWRQGALLWKDLCRDFARIPR